MNVAIAHDYLTVMGGAERVVLSLARAFPDAPVYTSLYRPEALFPELRDEALDVRPGPLNRSGLLRNHYRAALPLLPLATQRVRIDADVVLCNSSGWSHGVQTDGAKVVYCHNPARWLYQRDAYLSLRRPSWWLAATCLGPALRRWDQRMAADCDVYVASSTEVAQRIKVAYGREAEIVNPPSSLDPDGALEPLDLEPGFALTVGRLLPYKHIDAVVEAFRQEPSRRLVVVGDGPGAADLRRDLPKNVVHLERVNDDQLRWLYTNASCLVSSAIEDFGLTPIEAAMFGTTSVLIRQGGFSESMQEGATTTFFDAVQPGLIRGALARHDAEHHDAQLVSAFGRSFSQAAFSRRFQQIVAAASNGSASTSRSRSPGFEGRPALSTP